MLFACLCFFWTCLDNQLLPLTIGGLTSSKGASAKFRSMGLLSTGDQPETNGESWEKSSEKKEVFASPCLYKAKIPTKKSWTLDVGVMLVGRFVGKPWICYHQAWVFPVKGPMNQHLEWFNHITLVPCSKICFWHLHKNLEITWSNRLQERFWSHKVRSSCSHDARFSPKWDLKTNIYHSCRLEISSTPQTPLKFQTLALTYEKYTQNISSFVHLEKMGPTWSHLPYDSKPLTTAKLNFEARHLESRVGAKPSWLHNGWAMTLTKKSRCVSCFPLMTFWCRYTCFKLLLHHCEVSFANHVAWLFSFVTFNVSSLWMKHVRCDHQLAAEFFPFP